MRTAGSPNLVITTRSCISLPGTTSDGMIAVHSRAVPPTAECGQPGL